MKQKMILSVLFALSCCQADVTLPALIGDHMLVQRDVPVRIFGRAAAGEAVTVSFRGQNVQTTADPVGRWQVWLAPMKPAALNPVASSQRSRMIIAPAMSSETGRVRANGSKVRARASS